jgi:transposase
MGRDGHIEQEVRSVGTLTRDLLALADWLAGEEVTHVAMESTGVYWKPIYNILEGRFTILLVNARHIKHVPGRKTDVQDCQWLAQLLQCGLLKGSLIPERPQRELRDLTRHRAQLVHEKSAVINRVHKVLGDANIKLGTVAADILGKSGRDMIEALIGGEKGPEEIAELARRKLRGKIPQLRLALEGKVTDHHRFILRELMNYFEYLDGQIERFSRRIEEVSRPFEEVIERVARLPGFERRSAQNLVAEIGGGYGSVSFGRPSFFVGGDVSREPGECRQEEEWEDHQGKQVDSDDSDPGGLGGFEEERVLFPGSIPASGGSKREEACFDCAGTFTARGDLPYPQRPYGIQGTGCRLFG